MRSIFELVCQRIIVVNEIKLVLSINNTVSSINFRIGKIFAHFLKVLQANLLKGRIDKIISHLVRFLLYFFSDVLVEMHDHCIVNVIVRFGNEVLILVFRLNKLDSKELSLLKIICFIYKLLETYCKFMHCLFFS